MELSEEEDELDVLDVLADVDGVELDDVELLVIFVLEELELELAVELLFVVILLGLVVFVLLIGVELVELLLVVLEFDVWDGALLFVDVPLSVELLLVVEFEVLLVDGWLELLEDEVLVIFVELMGVLGIWSQVELVELTRYPEGHVSTQVVPNFK